MRESEYKAANAMMAMHDYLKAQQPQSAEPVGWRDPAYEWSTCSAEMKKAHPERTYALTEPLYTNPQPSAGVATDAARDLLAERQRQISAEGWTPEHDDEHGCGQLAAAAACYALSASGVPFELWQAFWPWDGAWLKTCESRRSLVKAGALILAEIERLDRLNGKEVDRG